MGLRPAGPRMLVMMPMVVVMVAMGLLLPRLLVGLQSLSHS